jgi:hypothetical protein
MVRARRERSKEWRMQANSFKRKTRRFDTDLIRYRSLRLVGEPVYGDF